MGNSIQISERIACESESFSRESGGQVGNKGRVHPTTRIVGQLNSDREDSIIPLYSKVDIQDWNRKLRRKASKGWADWLLSDEWGWQWYITLTFKDIVHPEQANRYYHKFVRLNNERIYGKRYRRYHKGITWVRGLEYQRRGVIHFHSLFSGLPSYWQDEEYRFRAMKDWERTAENCGYARVYPYKEGACRYISKYISKGGELDIWVGDKKRLDLVSMFAV